MTLTAATQPETRTAGAIPDPSTRRPRRPRRWIRAAAPFAVLLVLWSVTTIAHAVEEPDLTEPGTLSPSGTGADGSSRLAAMLTAQGVEIERVTSGRQAIDAATGTDATVFVPTPDYVNPQLSPLVAAVRGRHRVVVVEPGWRTTLSWFLPIFRVDRRWATKPVAPGCATRYAAAAGAAAVRRTRYLVEAVTPSVNCYSGGLVGLRVLDAEILVVGASDPFRNSRIGERGNAALATSLLGEHGRVIWVDVHRREPVSLSPVNLPGLPDYRRPDRARGGDGDPLLGAFPQGLWASLVLALAGGLLLAVASARRLGPPVAEPLPVLVPSAETVTGRGRLYERVRARAATLEALRAAAIGRLRDALLPFGGPAGRSQVTGLEGAGTPAARELITRIAARAGMAPSRIRAVLYGSAPDTDDDLRRAVGELDALVDAVLRDNPEPAPNPPPPNPPGVADP